MTCADKSLPAVRAEMEEDEPDPELDPALEAGLNAGFLLSPQDVLR
jgi:hypothetical protein